MTTQTKLPQALFPDWPKGVKLTDHDGNMTEEYKLYFQVLTMALHNNFKNEGWVIPPLNAQQISSIEALYTPYIGQSLETLLRNLPDISGQFVYDVTRTERNSKQFQITYDASPSQIILTAQWRTIAYV